MSPIKQILITIVLSYIISTSLYFGVYWLVYDVFDTSLLNIFKYVLYSSHSL